ADDVTLRRGHQRRIDRHLRTITVTIDRGLAVAVPIQHQTTRTTLIEPPWVRWRLLSLEGWSHATGEVAGEADYASLLGSGEGTGGPSGAPGPFGGTWSWRDPADRATARIWDRDGAQVGQGRRYR